jgi:hypothetical protein
MTDSNYVHPKDCPDQKAAEADRKQHEAQRKKRQEQQEALARTEWLEWYASPRTDWRRSLPTAPQGRIRSV